MLHEKSHLKCPIGQTLAKSNEKWTSNLRTHRGIGSHRRRHLCLPLTWCLGKCLTAVAARFVSRTASFPTTSGSPQCSDLAYLGQYAWGATGNENMQRGMRLYQPCRVPRGHLPLPLPQIPA